MKCRAVLIAALLCGCSGYDPPIRTDHTAVKYQTDLGRCRREAEIKAEQIAGRTPFTEIASIFTSSEPERENVRTCMQGKGYNLS